MRFLYLIGLVPFFGPALKEFFAIGFKFALVDAYTDANLVAGKKSDPSLTRCAELFGSVGIAEVAAGDDANSVYRILKGLDPNLRLVDLPLDFDAFGAGGLASIGFYETNLGPVIDLDALAADIDISAALKRQDGMAAVDIADRYKKIFELAGHTIDTKLGAYDLCITVTVKGATGAGTIRALPKFLQG